MEIPRKKIGTIDLWPVYWLDPYTHCFIGGKSGGGKSVLMANWWREDHLYRNAKILIEPSGWLARECYSLSRGQAIYCSMDAPVSINPLLADYHPSTTSDLVAEAINQVIAVTTHGAIKQMTPKMRNILDMAIKYCLEHNRKSLVHVRDYIANLKGDGETRDGILSRVNFLINDERMREILCGNDSVKWGELIQKGQTFILDCFGMSKEKFVFAGTLVSHGIKNYFRHERPKKYQPVSIYVDEAHNFINTAFMDILKEGRKYKLSCVMATQDFASIDDRLARVILNVGTLITFRVGHREAQLLANEMGAIVPDEYDIITGKTIKFDTREAIQNLEKFYLAYMTPREKGLAKAPRPPFARKIEPKKAEPKKAPRGKWFELKPYAPGN
jgi:type IV secretory pathway VirB4 component